MFSLLGIWERGEDRAILSASSGPSELVNQAPAILCGGEVGVFLGIEFG